MNHKTRATMLAALITIGAGLAGAAEVEIDSATFGGLRARSTHSGVRAGNPRPYPLNIGHLRTDS